MMKGDKGIFLNRNRYILYAMAGSAVLFLGPTVLNSYWLKICSFLIVSLIIACSWNLIGGYCGYFSFGHGLFFGIGAYTIAIALLRYNVNFYLCIPLGGLVAAALALAMSPILRLKGFYFTLITLAAVEAAAVIFRKWSFTRGMKSWDVGWSFPRLASDATFYYFLALTFLLMLVSHIAFLASRRGFGTVAIREDDLMARGVGVNVTITRAYTFILSAFWVGVAGAIYAPMITYISPQAIFEISWSVKPIIVTIFGGLGTIVGPILGGGILSLIDQLLWERFLEYHNLIYAVLLIGIVMFLPEGLLSYYGRAAALFRRAPQNKA
jgi:branched-chain amino acid transport system permease protein